MTALTERDFRPDFVLISAGFDSREEDTLGTLRVTDAGFAELTRLAMSIADEHCGGRIVSCLEGGYNVDGTARATCAHVSTLAGLDWQQYKPSAARTRRIPACAINGPRVRHGLLLAPPEMANAVERVSVFDIAGRERHTVPSSHLGKSVYDLRHTRFGTAVNGVRVWIRGREPVALSIPR